MRKIPLFPLPGVVFFPGTLLPLHIFEPRYRSLVEDALAGERFIGMALVVTDGNDPGAILGNPPVRALGGAGKIVEHERLEDGRYNIVLEGAYRFRILAEEGRSLYRVATIEEAPPVGFVSSDEERRVVREVAGLFEEVRRIVAVPPLPPESLAAERLAGELALRLRLPTESLQLLLETDSLAERFEVLRERLTEWREIAGLLRPHRAESLNSLLN